MSAARFSRLFISLAALVALARAACALFGLEDDVAVVCGATPSSTLTLVLGVGFVVVHLLFVAVAPVLALAGGLIAVCVPIACIPKRSGSHHP